MSLSNSDREYWNNRITSMIDERLDELGEELIDDEGEVEEKVKEVLKNKGISSSLYENIQDQIGEWEDITEELNDLKSKTRQKVINNNQVVSAVMGLEFNALKKSERELCEKLIETNDKYKEIKGSLKDNLKNFLDTVNGRYYGGVDSLIDSYNGVLEDIRSEARTKVIEEKASEEESEEAELYKRLNTQLDSVSDAIRLATTTPQMRRLFKSVKKTLSGEVEELEEDILEKLEG